MKVVLMKHTPEPERAVAEAARLCYSHLDGEELNKKMTDTDVEKLVRKLISVGHASTFEHASFTFTVSGVSRALTHQLVRHRTFSFNQQSQRYVSFKNGFEYVTPNSIKNKEAVSNQYNEAMEHIASLYQNMVEEGVPAEDARYVLPNACFTNITFTANARALRHFMELRCCTRAQWEIRELANKILVECKKVAPLLFENAGASCVCKNLCPEGDMSCGKMKESTKKAYEIVEAMPTWKQDEARKAFPNSRLNTMSPVKDQREGTLNTTINTSLDMINELPELIKKAMQKQTRVEEYYERGRLS